MIGSTRHALVHWLFATTLSKGSRQERSTAHRPSVRTALAAGGFVTVLASACLAAPGAMAADKIYATTPYAGTSRVYVANLDGSSAALTPLLPTTADNPSGVAVDTGTDRLY